MAPEGLEVGATLKGDLVTTEAVLIELLNFFSAYGHEMRVKSAAVVYDSLDLPGVQVIEQTRESFLSALSLYNARQDKSYSLTDCMSRNTMRELRIADVLTHDNHFTPGRVQRPALTPPTSIATASYAAAGSRGATFFVIYSA